MFCFDSDNLDIINNKINLKSNKMKKIENPAFEIKLTKEEALQLGINPDIEKQHAEIETAGPWQICTSFKALCVSKTFGKYSETKEIVLHGQRTISRPKNSGYTLGGLGGYVSIKGKKYSCYTSSQYFNVDGKTIKVETINARM